MAATFYDIINGLIDHTGKDIFIFESDGSAHNEVYLCKDGDEYYREHREELFKRKFYFMSIRSFGIDIYVRPENWKKGGK